MGSEDKEAAYERYLWDSMPSPVPLPLGWSPFQSLPQAVRCNIFIRARPGPLLSTALNRGAVVLAEKRPGECAGAGSKHGMCMSVSALQVIALGGLAQYYLYADS